VPLASGIIFKWIKQHLRIKAFYGTSRTPFERKCGSRSACMSRGDPEKELKLDRRLSEILQILASRFSRKTSFLGERQVLIYSHRGWLVES